MKTIMISFILLFFVTISFSADKSKYDLKPDGLKKSLNGFYYQQNQNDISEITMISGGYFTIGTTNGLDTGPLDDHCGITFGHPYAMTSYPVFSVDGNWYKLEEYFTDFAEIAPTRSGDTLQVNVKEDNLFSFLFAMINNESNQEIEFIFKIKNLDTLSHTFGSGLIFDPGLGKWGDGHLQIGNEYLFRDTLLNAQNIDSVKIMERN